MVRIALWSLFIFFLFLAFGVLVVFDPKWQQRPALEAGPVISVPMFTVVVVRNPSKQNITITRGSLFVNCDDIHNYDPSKPPEWSGQELLLQKDNRDDPDTRTFFGSVNIVVPPGESLPIRVRLKNKDYPGLTMRGRLTLVYRQVNEERELHIEPVPADVISWD